MARTLTSSEDERLRLKCLAAPVISPRPLVSREELDREPGVGRLETVFGRLSGPFEMLFGLSVLAYLNTFKYGHNVVVLKNIRVTNVHCSAFDLHLVVSLIRFPFLEFHSTSHSLPAVVDKYLSL